MVVVALSLPRAGGTEASDCRQKESLDSLDGSAAGAFAGEDFSVLCVVLAVALGVRLSAIAESAKRPLRKGLLERVSGDGRSSVTTVVVVGASIALGLLHGASPTEEFLRAYLGANTPFELNGALASLGCTNAYGLSTCFS